MASREQSEELLQKFAGYKYLEPVSQLFRDYQDDRFMNTIGWLAVVVPVKPEKVVDLAENHKDVAMMLSGGTSSVDLLDLAFFDGKAEDMFNQPLSGFGSRLPRLLTIRLGWQLDSKLSLKEGLTVGLYGHMDLSDNIETDQEKWVQNVIENYKRRVIQRFPEGLPGPRQLMSEPGGKLTPIERLFTINETGGTDFSSRPSFGNN